MNPRRWAAAALIALVLLPALLASPSPAADASGSQALGMSGLSEAAGEDNRSLETLFASPSALRTEPDAALVVLPGLTHALTPGEVRALEHQMQPEGEIWLMDETGAANALTEDEGVRVVPDRLLNPASPYGDPGFVEAQARVGNQTYDLILTQPALLEVDEDEARVLARARDAVHDVDRSGEVEATDPSGDHPVMATMTVNDRRVLVSSDRGVLMNTALNDDNYDNAAFLDALLDQASDGGLVLDASHHDASRTLAPVKAATQALLWLATNWIALGLTAAGVTGATLLALSRAPDGEELGGHELELGRRQPLDPDNRKARMRSLLARVLSGQGTEDPSKLLTYTDEELRAEAQRVLGTEEYLRGEADMEPRFRDLRAFLQPGGTDS